MFVQNIDYKGKDSLVLGDGIQTDSFVPVTATVYKRGDLIEIAPLTNVGSHPTLVGTFNVVCLEDVTAEQATAAIAAAVEIPCYTQGELNVLEVTLKGVKLDAAKQKAARGRANTATSIELRMPFGIKGA